MQLLCRSIDKRNASTQAQASARTKLGALHADESVPNQDTYFNIRSTDNILIVGVFDGHGDFGHVVSTLASSSMQRIILTRLQSSATLRTILAAAFAETAQILSTSDCASVSGTTGTVLILRDDECVIAHAGDSCGVLYQRGIRKLIPRYISRPHRPGVCKTEDARIRAYGGIFRDGYVVDQVSRTKGIAVTRTLGDIDMVVNGCIPDPEIVTLRIMNRDIAFVIASDGLWDAIDVTVKSVAATIEANSGKDVHAICDAIIDHAGDAPYDDCTVIVIKLQ